MCSKFYVVIIVTFKGSAFDKPVYLDCTGAFLYCTRAPDSEQSSSLKTG